MEEDSGLEMTTFIESGEGSSNKGGGTIHSYIFYGGLPVTSKAM